MTIRQANKARNQEKPILFAPTMVSLILSNQKTQTRRIAKSKGIESQCSPFGKIGDYLWVRETWSQLETTCGVVNVYKADYPRCLPNDVIKAPKCIREYGYVWRPSIHMPKRISRLRLQIQSLRIERLQQLSKKDAMAEGKEGRNAIKQLATSWDTYHNRNECRWRDNPLVWVVEFDINKLIIH